MALEPRRLHPSAVAIYSADALRNAAFPLVVIIGATLLGGSLDTGALARAAIYGGIGLAFAVTVGTVRYRSTTYWLGAEAIHHLTGAVAKKATDVRFDRIEAIDVHQGLLQRAFGVFAVEVQTGAGGKGGEISLPALTPHAVAELRAARGDHRPVTAVEDGAARRITGRDLAIAALTAGQLGIVVPVLAGAFQVVQQLFDERRGEDAIRALPHSGVAIALAVAGVLVLAWLLSTVGALLAFGGFSVARDGDRLRIRRGFLQRREATVPVQRVRAVRVVEGIFRRPFGLAALTIEVTGYAEEAAAARTLFPLVRLRDVHAFLDDLLPELADDPRDVASGADDTGGRRNVASGAGGRRDVASDAGGRRDVASDAADAGERRDVTSGASGRRDVASRAAEAGGRRDVASDAGGRRDVVSGGRGRSRPPRRAARRYVLPPALLGAVVTAGAWFVVGPLALLVLPAALLYGRARWRAAVWRLDGGRLAVRSLRLARTTVLAPAEFRESHTLAQNLLQRHARLADLEVAFGKQTTARIRHLDAADARAAWAALV
ncbi:MAG TPA: PH domain-containing protein [Solirubrobacter sp.]|nr:PH domain-containing protein [Solirubrobacter sp.]